MAAPFVDGPLPGVVRELFNSDLKSSQAALAGYIREAPCDPMAHALAAAVPFYHHVSMRIPEVDTRSIVGVLLGSGIAMPPALQKEIGGSLRRAQALAGEARDPKSLLALCLVELVNRDGLALVSKRWNASLAHAERAHTFAHRLLEREPAAHDAYFVLGSTEYLVSRMPSPVRPFIPISGVTGDVKKAIAFCQMAAESGWCFREFARRTLVNLHLEQNRTAEAVKLLSELVVEFPGNQILRSDLQRLRSTKK